MNVAAARISPEAMMAIGPNRNGRMSWSSPRTVEVGSAKVAATKTATRIETPVAVNLFQKLEPRPANRRPALMIRPVRRIRSAPMRRMSRRSWTGPSAKATPRTTRIVRPTSHRCLLNHATLFGVTMKRMSVSPTRTRPERRLMTRPASDHGSDRKDRNTAGIDTRAAMRTGSARRSCQRFSRFRVREFSSIVTTRIVARTVEPRFAAAVSRRSASWSGRSSIGGRTVRGRSLGGRVAGVTRPRRLDDRQPKRSDPLAHSLHLDLTEPFEQVRHGPRLLLSDPMSGPLESPLGDEETTAGRQRANEIGQTPIPIVPVVHRGDRPDHGETAVVEGQVFGTCHTHIGGRHPALDHFDERRGRVDGGHARDLSPLGGMGDPASGTAADVEDPVTGLQTGMVDDRSGRARVAREEPVDP